MEQPGARVTCDLQAENNPRSNLRESHIRRLALRAQGLAAFHQLRGNAAALQAELDRILEDSGRPPLYPELGNDLKRAGQQRARWKAGA